MKIKKKLNDIMEKEYLRWRDENCQPFSMYKNCTFGMLQCYNNYKEKSCLNHKELFSNEFLNQEIEVEDTLTKEEKEYLKAVIEPFKNKIQYITYSKTVFLDGFETRNIEICVLEHETHPCYYELPTIKGFFEGMELDKEYTLEELGLKEE